MPTTGLARTPRVPAQKFAPARTLRSKSTWLSLLGCAKLGQPHRKEHQTRAWLHIGPQAH
eukprot:9927330-Alexandrium_andersonii.AAC.1